MDTNLILIGVAILVLLAAAIWLQMRKKESQSLEKHSCARIWARVLCG